MAKAVFSSLHDFRDSFIDGLSRILEQESLGAFILVCANATFDPVIYSRMQPLIRERFQDWYEKLQSELLHEAPKDDLSVFMRLIQLGIEHLEVTQFRSSDVWEIQYNQLRSFRPKRMAEKTPQEIWAPFRKDGFNFNKPFLQNEIFWEGEWLDRKVSLYYNKFPFADLHTLLVPEREQEFPQRLTMRYHQFVWDMLAQLAIDIPELAIAYNSYGAFASVNHLHFQMFARNKPLPVCARKWQHNGGGDAYPLEVQVYDDPVAAWKYIQGLHEAVTPYNLLYLPGRILVMPRRMQGRYDQPEWTPGFAWYEVCGGMTVSSMEDYIGLTSEQVESALGRLKT